MVSKRFLVKRLALLIPVLFGVASLVFAILHLSPGDPAKVIAGQRADQAFVEQVRMELGLDRPIWVQYVDFMTNIIWIDVSLDPLTIDFVFFELGNSYVIQKGRPVKGVLTSKLPVTIELAIYGQIMGILLGIPVGVLSAIKQDTVTDHLSRIGALTGISVPIFWSGPLLILLFAQFIGILPASGRIATQYNLPNTLWEGALVIPGVLDWGIVVPATSIITIDAIASGNLDAFVSAMRHLIMPAGVIGIYSMALISRMMRSSMLEVIRQDYMRTARAKGQGAKITIMKHGFRNAMIPVITVIGIQFGTLLGGAVLTETVFGIGGIGVTLVRAIEVNDYPVVQATVLMFAFLFTLVNLGVDLTYSYLDPRIEQ